MQSRKSAEEELISVVRLYAEEFGPENILIAVPIEWECLGEALTGFERTRLVFTTSGKIEVSAYDRAVRRLHYEIDAEVIIAEAMASQSRAVA